MSRRCCVSASFSTLHCLQTRWVHVSYRAVELMKASAFRKAESMPLGGSPFAYAKANVFKECEALANSCCSLYFVPVESGSFEVTDENCSSKVLATVSVTGGAGNTVTPDAGPKVATVPANLKAAEEEDWSGWEEPTEIEVALGARLPAPAGSTHCVAVPCRPSQADVEHDPDLCLHA
jgi:hypothetical protein